MNPFLRKRISRSPSSALTMQRAVSLRGSEAPCSVVHQLSPGTRVPVAIIVIGHNGASFLGECLASVFAQTVTPDEILYVDDASTDDSLSVARAFADRGLQIVSLPENVGMNAARMAGFDRSAAPLLLFVDCDNVLSPDFLATMAAELAARPNAAFTCPGKRFIGDPDAIAWRKKWHPDGTWTPPSPSRATLWRENHCDTCALVRREAFVAAGAWQPNAADTMFDWDLFLRISRSAPYLRSAARLDYRVHRDNWSERERGRDRSALNGIVRRAAATITVATMWSGRLGFFHRPWLKAVTASLRRAGKTAELLILDDSPAGFPLDGIDRSVFTRVSHRSVRRQDIGTRERRPDRRATAEFLAGLCNEALATATSDVLWIIEDDILIPEHAADRLLHELLQVPGAPHPAVCGAYRSRHPGQEHWIAAGYKSGRVRHWPELPKETTPVPLTGTGCLMILRDLLGDTRFHIEWQHDGKRSPAHDWTFAWQLWERGTPVRLVPDVVCNHLA